MKKYKLNSKLVVELKEGTKHDVELELMAAICAIVEEAGGEVAGEFSLKEVKE